MSDSTHSICARLCGGERDPVNVRVVCKVSPALATTSTRVTGTSPEREGEERMKKLKRTIDTQKGDNERERESSHEATGAVVNFCRRHSNRSPRVAGLRHAFNAKKKVQ